MSLPFQLSSLILFLLLTHGGRSPASLFFFGVALIGIFYKSRISALACHRTQGVFLATALIWIFVSSFFHPPFLNGFHAGFLGTVFFLFMLALQTLPVNDLVDTIKLFSCAATGEALFLFGNVAVKNQHYGLLGNPLHDGLFLVAGFAFMLAWFQESFHKRDHVLLGIGLGIQGLGVFLTHSKSATAALLFIVVLKLSTSRKIRAGWAAAFFAAVLALPFLIPNYLASLHLDRIGREMTAGRIVIWKTGFKSLLDHPWMGYGAGNFEQAYQLHQLPSTLILRFGQTTGFAHNFFLQSFVDYGIPFGVLVLSGFLILFLKSLLSKTPKSAWVRSAILVFISYGIIGSTNYILVLPLQFLALSLANSVLFHYLDENKIRLHAKGAVPLCLGGVGAMLLLCQGGVAASDFYFKRGQFEKSVQWMPYRDDARYELGLACLRKAASSLEVEVCEKELDKALSLNPRNPFYWNRKALVAAAKKRSPDLVRSHFKEALRWAPAHAPFYIEWAEFEIRSNNGRQAESLLAKAAELEPASPRVDSLLGMIKLKTGEKAAAKEYFLKSIEKARRASRENLDWSDSGVLTSEYGKYLISVNVPAVESILAELK